MKRTFYWFLTAGTLFLGMVCMTSLLAQEAGTEKPAAAFPPEFEQFREGRSPGEKITLTLHGVPFTFVWVPGGSLTRDELNVLDPKNAEKRRRYSALQTPQVAGFWMLETEVTMEMFRKLIAPEIGDLCKEDRVRDENKMGSQEGAGPENPGYEITDAHPVTCIYWSQARIFARKVTNVLQEHRRDFSVELPSAFQWFRAAGYFAQERDGASQVSDFLEQGWFWENSRHSAHPVGQKKPNELGIFDLFGNVQEWCRGPDDNVVSCGGSWRQSTLSPAVLWACSQESVSCRNSALGMRLVLKPPLGYGPAVFDSGIDPGAEKTCVIDGVKFRFRWCPPGKFGIGRRNVMPSLVPHDVIFSRGFWILDSEVTNRMWSRIMGEAPADEKLADHPKTQISWEDCRRFCAALSQKMNFCVTLPTEAQWEYACCAGKYGDFPSREIFKYANLKGKKDGRSGKTELLDAEFLDQFEKTAPVRSFPGNAWGICDMIGNVQEWCLDGYGFWSHQMQVDPHGLMTGKERCVRGGSWQTPAKNADPAYRFALPNHEKADDLGFRIVVLPNSKPVSPEKMAEHLRFLSTPIAELTKPAETAGSQKTDTKPDAPKPDAPKPDVPKPDVPKSDVPKSDVPKSDVPKSDVPKSDVPKSDVPKMKEERPAFREGAGPIESMDISTSFPPEFEQFREGRSPGEKITLTLHGVPFTFVWVPGGSLIPPELSSNLHGEAALKAPKPEISGFWMLETEVTMKMFRKFMESGAWENRPDQAIVWNGRGMVNEPGRGPEDPGFKVTDEYPVTCIHWTEALSFAEWISHALKECGCTADLPTHSQWVLAARYSGRHGTRNSELSHLLESGWLRENSEFAAHPVRQKKPNELGIFDLFGNVQEWVRSDPFSRLRMSSSSKAETCGGSWVESVLDLADKKSTTSFHSNSSRTSFIGMRLVLKPDEKREHFAPGTKPGEEKVVQLNGPKFRFRWCPPGKFRIGRDPLPPSILPHDVTLTEGFWILESEVTSGMWNAVMAETVIPFPTPNDHPKDHVSWVDCRRFCAELSQRMNLLVDLPTEAQWEYACRAGESGSAFLNDELKFTANLKGKSVDPFENTAPVGSFERNPWGLCDMIGNVREWCLDGYGPWTEKPQTDPVGPMNEIVRCVRGGGWNTPPENADMTFRSALPFLEKAPDLGFRIVVRPTAEPLSPDSLSQHLEELNALSAQMSEPVTGTAPAIPENAETSENMDVSETSDGFQEMAQQIDSLLPKPETGKPVVETQSGETLEPKPVPQRRKPAPAEGYVSGINAAEVWEVIRKFPLPEPGMTAGERLVLEADGVSYAFRWCSPMPSGPHREALKGFWILETEVTVPMWESVMGTEHHVLCRLREKDDRLRFYGLDSVFSPEKDLVFPMPFVSRKESEEFCMKLSLMLKKQVALPRQDQWIHAYRCGGKWEKSGDSLQEFGWLRPESQGKIHPAGTKKPNDWGICDMAGNLSEWCWESASFSDQEQKFGWMHGTSAAAGPVEPTLRKVPSRIHSPYHGFRVILVPEHRKPLVGEEF